MASRLYVDTSAYLSVILGEERGAEVEARFAGAELLTSALLFLEAPRALIRLARQDKLTPERYLELVERVRVDQHWFLVRELTVSICTEAVYPSVSLPRSLDLAHLRTARRFHLDLPLTAFLSLDARQLLAARELGLPT